MTTHPLPIDESARLACLASTKLVGSPSLPAFDSLVALASDVLDVPIVLISLVDRDIQWFQAGIGFDGLRQTARELSFCAHAIARREPLVVEDAREDARFAGHPWVLGEPGLRFYAGIPLCPIDDLPLGTLCIYDHQPRRLDAQALERLRLLAQQAEVLIQHHQAKQISARQNRQLSIGLARKEAILNEAAVGIIRIDAKGLIQSANPFVFKLLGYTESELFGKNVKMLMPAPWAAQHDEYLAAYQRTRVPRVIGIGREVAARHKAGHTIPVHLAVSQVRVPGAEDRQESTEFIGILSDLSELRAAHAREEDQHRLLEVLHRGMTDFASLMTHNSLWTFLKEALCELTESDYGLIGEVIEVDARPSLKIHAITDLSWNEDSRQLMYKLRSGDMRLTNPDSMLGRSFAGGEIVMSNDVAGETRRTGFPPGHPPLSNYLGVPIVDEDRVIGMYSIANSRREITPDLLKWLEPFTATCALLIKLYRSLNERDAFIRELEVAHAEQARMSKAKSEFLSSMSHELRTPLNAIIGFSQLLMNSRTQSLSPRQSGQVEEILKSGEHLLRLINDVLDLAKIEAGRMSCSLEPVRLGPLVNDALGGLRPLAERGGIVIRPVSLQGDLAVIADFTRLKQVLINLLSNAIKYNRQGGHLEVQAEAVAGGMVRIQVCDSGVGIPVERQDELFQPFNRLGAEGSAIEGTGVGLALCRQLMSLMAGEIGVDSRQGVGSCFWLTLPQAQGLAPGEAAEEMPTGSLLPAQVGGVTRRVMYIEDNPANQRLMQDVFEDLPQWALECLPDAITGLTMAHARHPDLILMDINLPGMDGYAAIRQIRQSPELAKLPVVALSANALPGDIERGLAAGFDAYLTKPIQLGTLLDTLERFLESAR